MTDGGSASVIDALEAAADLAGDRGFVYHLAEGEHRTSYAQMRSHARGGARVLADLGIGPGDPVGVLGPTRPEWVGSALAAWGVGAALVPIPFGMQVAELGGLDRIQAMIDASGCRRVLADPRFAAALPDVCIPWDQASEEEGTALARPDPSDVAVLQFTSGSTSAPKIAEITHGGVLACVAGFTRSWNVDVDDVGLSWLPLFHDNGLFGHVVTAIVEGLNNHLIPTERFARNPALWFRLVGEVGATLTSGPSSAWSVALRTALEDPSSFDMSTLRGGIVSAEAVDPALVERFAEYGASLGLRPGTLCGAYGLAEATLLVTIARPGEGARIDRIDVHELARSGRAVPVAGAEGVRRVVSSGRPTHVVSIRIAGAGGSLPEREVGEIQVRGPQLMRGYRNLETSAQPFTDDGWLATGDLGYISDSELFVTGRLRDLVIVFGRNYAPEDFEWIAGRVSGVRTGRCVAFNRPGEAEGGVVVVFELRPGADADETAADVRQAVWRSLGVAVAEAIPAVKGTIPKTTSGKLRRGALRDAYAEGHVVRASAPNARSEG
jgi:fatty-acyl-CoA synthase